MRVYEGEKLGRRITAMPPQISIPLDLPDVRVLQTEIDAKGDYIKNPADVQPPEAEVLEALFRFSPVLKQAYDLREELTKIFNKW
jgi:hypothetical protein